MAVASAQNPVLSKLLMADQDGPLDLSVRKNQDEPEPCQQGEDNAHAGSLVHAHTHAHVSNSNRGKTFTVQESSTDRGSAPGSGVVMVMLH